MTVVDRTFLVVGVAALSAAIAFGGLWDRQSRAAFATGDASNDSGVQEAYADALEVVKANYAGATEIETVNKYAILGMLRVLDPHSSFLDSREFSELQNEQQSQLIGIGVLGEYIGRIVAETKRRPLFLVGALHGFDERGAGPSVVHLETAAAARGTF